MKRALLVTILFLILLPGSRTEVVSEEGTLDRMGGTAAHVPAIAAPQELIPVVTQPTSLKEDPACVFMDSPGSEYRQYLPLVIEGKQTTKDTIVKPKAQVAQMAQSPTDVDLTTRMAFLYAGPDAVQRGLSQVVIDPQRAAVLRGRTCTRDGQSLPDVTITILDHSEYGSTSSQADGTYDMMVNGGELLTIVYNKTGYLPAHRQITAPWQEFAWLPEVALIPLDQEVTTIDLSANSGMQIARGSIVVDDDGRRQATLLIPPDTTAHMSLEGGETQPLSVLSIRATEYSVGAGGPAAMPAELPPSSGYTYALEYSVDEALATNATEVSFNQPLYDYVENFLDFPIGMAVPVGYYDRHRATWVPSENGRVVQIVSITNGLANVDTDGDGVADNDPALGITSGERQQLAILYQPGTGLWRVPITHFTPWDYNWPYGPPSGALPPAGNPQPIDQPADKPNCQSGSVIECQNQTLGEQLAIVGTPYTLNYQSNRVPGRIASYTLNIPLSGDTIPENLMRIDLEIFIAGRRFVQEFPAAPDQEISFTWDGRDAYDNRLGGKHRATVRIGYVYEAVYQEPAQFNQSFAALSGIPITGSSTRQEVTLWKEWQGLIGGWDARIQGLGGWSLDVHHSYDSSGKILYLGDGRRQSGDGLSGIIETVAGGGWVPGYEIGDGGPAIEAELFHPYRVAAAPDNSFYIADWEHQRVRRVDPDGIIHTIAGTGIWGYNGDNMPATQAQLNYPADVALGPDGSIYIADRGNNRVRRVGKDGMITTVAGTGDYGYNGDGIQATQAILNEPYGIAVGPDGTLYIADSGNHRIRRVTTDGIINTVTGTDTSGYSGDGGPATLAQLSNPWDVALGPDRSLYIADRSNAVIRRVGLDGIIITVAGTGESFDYSGDGGPATEARLHLAIGIVVAADGSLYIADEGNNRIRMVGSDGIIVTIAGDGTDGDGGNGEPATRAQLSAPGGVALAPDGSLLIADRQNHLIRRVAPLLPGSSVGEIRIAAENNQEIYVFSATGRHLHTLHALTGATLYTFNYDANGRLVFVVDGDGNTTTITRNGAGVPMAIVGPFGQQTTLAVNGNDFLTTVINPAGEVTQFSVTPGGLMTGMTDARGNSYTFTYDYLGRLVREDDPAGGIKTLTHMGIGGSYSVTLTSGIGRTSIYEIVNTTTGDEVRVNTQPSGLKVEEWRGSNGIITNEGADGVQKIFTLGADPRWGLQAPIPDSVLISTPGGLQTSFSQDSKVTLADPADLFSLVSLEDTLAFGLRNYIFSYDTATKVFTETTPEQRKLTTVIDDQGRIIWEQIDGLFPVTYDYNGNGQLVSLTQGIENDSRIYSLSYDSSGYLAALIDPLGKMVQFTYDDTGRIKQLIRQDGQIISYAYDANSNLTSLTPPSRPVHSFTHTPVNLVATYTPPDILPGSEQTTYTYNPDRQLVQISRPGGTTIDYDYDQAGRLESMAIGRGMYNYTYDPVTGNPATVSAPDGITLVYSYDGFLPIGQSWTGLVAGSVQVTYDNDFRPSLLTVNGNHSISYQYDNDSLLTRAGDLTLSRDPQNGLLTGSLLGDISDIWTYNGFGEVVSYSAVYDNNTLYATQYERDLLGRIITKTETIEDLTTTTIYQYDLVRRLVGVTTDGMATAVYTYDANGNRLSQTDLGGTVTGNYDAQDRLLQYGDTTFTYTDNGELLTRKEDGQNTTYNYDEWGNLLGVSLPDGTEIAYLVDGQNRRIGRLVNGTLVQGWLYEDQLRPVAELDGWGNVVSRFIYATHVNVPDYMVQNGTTYRILTDHLGSPRLVVDIATGQVVQRLDYDAFGQVLLDTNPGFQPFGFAGGLYDPATGLVRFGERDYDGQIGRWTLKDPALFPGRDTNLYVYVGNSPVEFTDPQGLQESKPAGSKVEKLKKYGKEAVESVKNFCQNALCAIDPSVIGCSFATQDEQTISEQFEGASGLATSKQCEGVASRQRCNAINDVLQGERR